MQFLAHPVCSKNFCRGSARDSAENAYDACPDPQSDGRGHPSVPLDAFDVSFATSPAVILSPQVMSWIETCILDSFLLLVSLWNMCMSVFVYVQLLVFGV